MGYGQSSTGNPRRGGVVGGGTISGATGNKVDYSTGDERIYTTKTECIRAIMVEMDKYPRSRDNTCNNGVNYSADYNSWFNSTGFEFVSVESRQGAKRKDQAAYGQVIRTLRWTTNEGPVIFSSSVISTTVKAAMNESCWRMFYNIRNRLPKVQMDDTTEYIQDCLFDAYDWQLLKFEIERPLSGSKIRYWPRLQFDVAPTQQGVPHVQMDNLTEQGDTQQESVKVSNTIITADQAASKSEHVKDLMHVNRLVSTEPLHSFGMITDRWMPLKSFQILTTYRMGYNVLTLYLPEAIFSLSATPNLIPFETFIYGRMAIELRMVVNANKFHCGKLIVSSKYDSYQADQISSGYQSALARNHVIIDLTANNEGILQIPFRYHRPMMRLVNNEDHSPGVRPSKYCSVYLQILSPLQTGPDGSSAIDGRVFYRLRDAQFAGMSYRVKVQMFGVEDIISGKTSRALKEVLSGAERAFDQLGRNDNQDKPGISTATIVVPKPRLNFCTGKGSVDVNPLRINPNTLTNMHLVDVPDDEPKNFYELARIWGIYKEITWSSTNAAGDLLMDFILDPTSRSYSADFIGEPSPLEFACANFMFWNGTIELRFDFVSNSFHTGAVMISAEFGRQGGAVTEVNSTSTYTKTFHLGEQKTVDFRVPYIYDTVFRRTTAGLINPLGGVLTNDGLKSRALTIAPESRTHIRMRVMNGLRPVASAPQEIKILVFIRAGKNFSMHGVKGNSCILEGQSQNYDDFPNNYEPVVNSSGKRVLSTDRTLNVWGEKKPEKLELGKFQHKTLYVKPSVIGAPKIQMDNGEKEDQDPTENFLQGSCALPLQTLDCHMNFKDMLRRPTLMYHRITIKPSNLEISPYFIPLCPPSKDMCMQATDRIRVRDFAPTLNQTTAVAITSMFRCWRGGQRYTIVVWRGTKPIFFSLIPHSGVRIAGNMPIVRDSDGTNTAKMPLYGFGFISEMMVPTINPTMTIEAPYDTENVWTLMADDDPGLNYSWRDKGDYNAGHLAITVEEEVEISVFWSAADDFEIANFYGMPYVKNNGWAYRFNDTHARVQMDFVPEETRTMVRGLIRHVTPKNLVRTALGSVPVIGTGLVAASVASDVSMVVEKTIPSIVGTAEKIGRVAETVNVGVLEIRQLIGEAIQKVQGTFSACINMGTMLFDLMLDIIMAWMEKSWRIAGMAIVRLFTKIIAIKTGALDRVVQYGDALGETIGRWFMEQSPTVQAEASSSSTLTGILIGLVGTVMGVVIDQRRTRRVPMALLERITSSSGASYLLSVLRYVQGIFEYIKSLVMEALGYVSPEAQALRMLSIASPQIELFVREAQIVCSEANGGLVTNGRFRLRFWKTVLMAYQFQRILSTIPVQHTNAQLSRLCGEVIKIGNEKFLDLAASPVRYEPFVICLEGAAGVGKSSATESLVMELLTSIGYNNPSATSIYFRTAGEKFWSGYRDQPVVVYDEWMNTCDAQRNYDMIVELQKLKSTALFNPEMAHLSEKKMFANPLIVVILTNDAFPTKLSDYSTCPAAILRRRDIVLRARGTSEYAGRDLHDLARSGELVNMPHLEFALYRNSRDRATCTSDYRKYNDMVTYVKTKYQRYHANEVVLVKARMERALAHLQNVDIGEIHLYDPFTMFYGLNARIRQDDLQQNAWTPYEELELAVQTIVDHVNDQQPQIIPEPPCDVAWEDLGETQSWTTMVGGILLTSGCFSWLAGATRNQLAKWRVQSGIDQARYYECCVCLEQRPCSYVCTQTLEVETQHLVCLECYSSLVTLTNGSCPMCRCPSMTPYIDTGAQRNFGLWIKLLKMGMASLEWVCQRIQQYYSWRSSYPIITLFSDYLLNIAMAVVRIRINPGLDNMLRIISDTSDLGNGMLCGRICVVAYNEMRNLLGFTQPVAQADDWGEVPDIESVPSTSTADMFTPVINGDYMNRLMDGETGHPVCLHQLLTPQVGQVRIVGDQWSLPDQQTGLEVRIPFMACAFEECPARHHTYRIFVGHYKVAHDRDLRMAYIAYYNNPTRDTLERIPRMYRASWMEEIPTVPISSTWWESLTGIWAQYGVFITFASAALATLTTVYGLIRLVGSFSGSTQGQVIGSGPQSPRHHRAEVRSSRGRQYFQAGEVTPTPLQVAMRYVVNNTFIFSTEKQTGGELLMYGVGLFNHYVLIPRHYVRVIRRALQENREVWGALFSKPQTRALIQLGVADIKESENTDLALIRLQPSFPLFKDLRKFIATEDDWDRGQLPSQAYLLATPARGCDFMTEVLVDVKGVDAKRSIIDQNDEWFEVQDVLVYNFSRPGACGSIIFSPNSTRPVLGMHFAGVGELLSGEGYAIILTRESLGGTIQAELPAQLEDAEFGTIEDATMVFDESVRVNYLGSLEREKVPYISKTSKLQKSLIYGCEGLQIAVEPAIMHKTDKRYQYESTPLYEGTRKHGLLTDDFNPEDIAWAKSVLWDGWYQGMKPLLVNPQILTPEQAIVGLDMNHYKGMDLTTSAGYPYVLSDRKTKREYIDVIRDKNEQVIGVKSIDSRVLFEKNRKCELRKKGIVPLTYFIDTLKDEKRKTKKVLSRGGTRVFCNSPLDYVIECRQHFMHFIASFMEHRHSLMHAVGVNPMGREWTRIANELLCTSKHIVTIDYSNFGPGYNAGVAKAAYDIMVDWTMENVGGSNRLELETMVYECLQSTHVCHNTVYHQVGGSPSGAVFTTIVNSLVNQLYILLAWKALMKDHFTKITDIGRAFKRYVKLYVYGDDAILSVDDRYIEQFNGRTIHDYFAKYKIVSTDATKSGKLVDYTSIFEATFLKRGFKRHPNRDEWMGPLDDESLLGTTQWTWKGPDAKGATFVNAEAALLQAHGHGPAFFKGFKQKVNKALISRRCPTLMRTWEELDELFYDDDFSMDLDYILTGTW